MQNHHMSRCFKSSDMARRQIDGGNNPFFLVLMIVVLSGMYVLITYALPSILLQI